METTIGPFTIDEHLVSFKVKGALNEAITPIDKFMVFFDGTIPVSYLCHFGIYAKDIFDMSPSMKAIQFDFIKGPKYPSFAVIEVMLKIDGILVSKQDFDTRSKEDKLRPGHEIVKFNMNLWSAKLYTFEFNWIGVAKTDTIDCVISIIY
jgi:hypothetical protein